MSALDVSGLGVELGHRRVIDNVTVGIDRGEFVGLIGPNGAGKTTLLRTILGLVRPVGGSVLVDGRPVRPGRTHVGYVPQRHDVAWDFPISVANTVMTGLTGRIGLLRRPAAADWDAVAEALQRVAMTDLAERPIGELSGGQRQRVLVARALALRPTILLLDEPFTGLDLPTQDHLSDLFADLAAEGRAVLMTTHDLVAAVDSCDRLVLLNRTIVADGTPGELVARPEVWADAFGVGSDSTLLRMLKAV